MDLSPLNPIVLCQKPPHPTLLKEYPLKLMDSLASWTLKGVLKMDLSPIGKNKTTNSRILKT